MLKGIALILSLLSAALMAVSAYSAIMCVRLRNRGVPFSYPLESPFNILFRPHELTAEGLLHRRRCFIAIACALALSFIAFSMTLIAESLG